MFILKNTLLLLYGIQSYYNIIQDVLVLMEMYPYSAITNVLVLLKFGSVVKLLSKCVDLLIKCVDLSDTCYTNWLDVLAELL